MRLRHALQRQRVFLPQIRIALLELGAPVAASFSRGRALETASAERLVAWDVCFEKPCLAAIRLASARAELAGQSALWKSEGIAFCRTRAMAKAPLAFDAGGWLRITVHPSRFLRNCFAGDPCLCKARGEVKTSASCLAPFNREVAASQRDFRARERGVRSGSVPRGTRSRVRCAAWRPPSNSPMHAGNLISLFDAVLARRGRDRLRLRQALRNTSSAKQLTRQASLAFRSFDATALCAALLCLHRLEQFRP